MSINSGLILVERFLVSRTPGISVSATKVRSQYRGFDGIAWPGNTLEEFADGDGLAGLQSLAALRSYYERLPCDEYDLLFCCWNGCDPPSGFQFLGYDVGYWQSAYNHFSVILNEVIYGSTNAFLAFGERLNSNLLLDFQGDADSLVVTRKAQRDPYLQLETITEVVCKVAVFGMPRTSNNA